VVMLFIVLVMNGFAVIIMILRLRFGGILKKLKSKEFYYSLFLLGYFYSVVFCVVCFIYAIFFSDWFVFLVGVLLAVVSFLCYLNFDWKDYYEIEYLYYYEKFKEKCLSVKKEKV